MHLAVADEQADLANGRTGHVGERIGNA